MVSGDHMTATLVLFPPGIDEPPISEEEAVAAVKEAGVTYGLDEAAVLECVFTEKYNNPIVIARGTPPKRGKRAAFKYHFDTSEKHAPKEDEDGRIDYKDISFIRNTEKGTVLVTKIPPTPGIPGRTVLGRELKAQPGQDVPFDRGPNTGISSDGLKLLAAANGAIVFQHGKVAVNDLIVIRGDVDYSVGNIDCRATVRVGGDVKAGFSLNIHGDLEVNGHIEDCDIDVKGNIVVKGGFFGKGVGLMQAGGDITVKFAEGQRMAAGGTVWVGGEIINCSVLAKKGVLVSGKHGKIIGGEVKAGRQIKASVLGSEAGTRTHLYVGFDAELMQRYKDVMQEQERLQADRDRVETALDGLCALEAKGKLPPDKERALAELKQFHENLPVTLEALGRQREEIEEKIREFQDSAIIAEKVVHPGVVAHFGIASREIHETHKACRLTCTQDGQIRITEIKPSDG
jgi:hypothetical protein